MKEGDSHKILKLIMEKTKDFDFEWRLEGSANLFVQGMLVSVRDLDITSTKNGIKIFENVLSEYSPNCLYNQEKKFHSLVCFIDGFEVEVNAYDKTELNMFDKIKKNSWKDLVIPILPLKSAKLFYSMINRTEKVELIEDHLLKLRQNL
ncbi:hypothetical protein HN587_02565 [Candidatus Woesearchaeota archaeon]|jgi:hypothetical protein|nr:hypothetical protein [Candidatus Woesearchaeota archaeon]